MMAGWSSMIRACVRNEQFSESLTLFRWMLRAGRGGDGHAIAAAAKACGRRRHLLGGCGLHGHAVAVGLEGNVFVKTSLLDMYSRCSALQLARRLFDEMPLRNLATWNAMILACARNAEVNAAFDLLGQMRVNGLDPNLSTFLGLLSGGILPHQCSRSLHCYGLKLGMTSELTFANSLIAIYSRGGWVNAAGFLFESMGERSAASWTALAGGFVNAGDHAGALEIFNRMRRSGLPSTRRPSWASAAHGLAVKSGFCGGGGISAANSLVSCYCKCGDLPAAERVFLSIPEKEKDVFSWTAMIAGYAENGGAADALTLSEEMVAAGVNPAEATVLALLAASAELGSPTAGRRVAELAGAAGLAGGRKVRTALIHMYSKCGDIHRAREVFSQISRKDLALWSCMVNGYAVNGMGMAAIELFEEMTAEGVDPDGAVFTSLLSACRHAGWWRKGGAPGGGAEGGGDGTAGGVQGGGDERRRGRWSGGAGGELRGEAGGGAREEGDGGEGLVKKPGWSRVEDEDEAGLVGSESLSDHMH
ncbi:unnamed protein product [Spirodela intermedia]|uniref:Uncharacterized protein n=1 Tax=Spirodela intermedia TaxID=51605 RepID=A0A7I8J2W3_SPIIN|nr:unnamed protein product [Spirodela intermedia]CAA6664399.1 unnamed protein product [Spirodela intermedia]